MPRYVYPADPLVLQAPAAGAPVLSAAGARVTVWADEAGTVPADLLTLQGQPLPPTLTVGPDSQLPVFLGPDDALTLFYGVPGRAGTFGVLRGVVPPAVGPQGPVGPQGMTGPASSTVAGTLGPVATWAQNASGPDLRPLHWARYGTVAITTQFWDATLRLSFLGGGSGNPVAGHMVGIVRVKQQAALGLPPAMSATVVEAQRNVSTDLALLLVENTPTRTTVDLFFRNNNSTFEAYVIHEQARQLNGSVALTYRSGALTDYLPALPTGLAPPVLSVKLPAFV